MAAFLFLAHVRADTTAIWLLTSLSAYALSVGIHELGHILAFAAVTRRRGEGRLVTRGVVIYVVRPALARWQEMVVTVAGPLSPALVAMVLSLSASLPGVVELAVWALAVGHALVLMLPVGDGHNLRQQLRQVGAASCPGSVPAVR